MRYGIVSVLLFISGFLLSTFILQQIGVSYEKLAQVSSVEPQNKSERFTLSNNVRAEVICTRSNQTLLTIDERYVQSKVSCLFYVARDYFVRADLAEIEQPSIWRQTLLILLTPRISDLARLEGREMNSRLTGEEKRFDSFDIAILRNGPVDLYVSGQFDVDKEALKALLSSYLSRAADMYEKKVVWGDVERMAEVGAALLATQTGAFKLREDSLIMILQGGMEYLIFSLAIVAVLFFARGVVLFDFLRESRSGNIMLRASSSLGGTLTYLGLLGTLIGMFGTVMGLSTVDFVDEMKKIFDQTHSFGAMGLAIGTSIVGLSGSVVVWLLHVLRSVALRRSMS